MDWNNDGHLDILSGCYWTEGAEGGQIQMLAGKGSLDFAEAESLNNSAGNPLQNEPLNEDKSNQTAIICTQQHAVDYDGDGDLDLVVGCFESSFYYYENTGDKARPALSETPVKLEVESPSYHAAPHLVDWDNDGDLDLLSGSGDGGVFISVNSGNRQKPVWTPFQILIPKSSLHEQNMTGGREIQPAPATRVWATDWNGDGTPDLLVGDCTEIVSPAEGLSAEEFERKRAAFDEKMAALSAKQSGLFQQLQAATEAGKEPDEAMTAAMQASGQEFQKLYDSRSEFQTSQSTGFVWLYMGKPATAEETAAGSAPTH